MAKKTTKTKVAVSKDASVVDNIYKALCNIKLSKGVDGYVTRARSALIKLSMAIVHYENHQVKLAEKERQKTARIAAKEQKAKERVKRSAIKTAKIQARINKLQAQLKQIS